MSVKFVEEVHTEDHTILDSDQRILDHLDFLLDPDHILLLCLDHGQDQVVHTDHKDHMDQDHKDHMVLKDLTEVVLILHIVVAHTTENIFPDLLLETLLLLTEHLSEMIVILRRILFLHKVENPEKLEV